VNRQRNNNQVRRCWLQLVLVCLLLASPITQAGNIHDAARAGDLEQLQKMVVQGADVNEKAVRDETPLMHAALAGQGEVVNYLLQRGANINARNASGMTALHAAAYAGHSDIVRLLIAKGAKVSDASNRFGVTALHVAAEENQIETVKTLLHLGVDVNVIEINGYSAISRSGFRQHWEVLTLLLANGANCQQADVVGDWLYQECTSRVNAN
jgi:ankyrin repeat protein